MLDIFEWRNDAHTRSMFKNRRKVKKHEHIEWFSQAINDPRRLLLIGEVSDSKVGIVRFDRSKRGWEVSINVAPSMRGSGHGHVLLKQGLEYLRRCGHREAIHADIREQNVASRCVFKKCGFELVSEDLEYVYMSLRKQHPPPELEVFLPGSK